MNKKHNLRLYLFFAAVLITMTAMAQTRIYNYSHNTSRDGMKVKASPLSPGLRCITFTSGNNRFYLSNENGYSASPPVVYNRVANYDECISYSIDLSSLGSQDAYSIKNQVDDNFNGYHATGDILFRDDFSVMMVILSNGMSEVWFLQ